jgi:two-component system, NtrC family, sensor kinase
VKLALLGRRVADLYLVAGEHVTGMSAAREGAKVLLANYLLPFLAVGVALMFAFCRASRREQKWLASELEQARTIIQQREEERNLARQELFRRFSDEGKLNKQKSQFEAQLAEYEKYAALTQLALGAAHEINNPLLGILSHLELELRVAEGDARTEIEQCIAGAKRIAVTLRSLMNYARPGPLILSKINLHRLVSETLAFLQHQPMLHAKVLDNQVPPDLPVMRVDANQLSQVLMNLLLNAAQATPEGGRITVSANQLWPAEGVEIRVTDTGCGIPAEILPRVFEPFFTTKRGKGTGLGLSISQAYVRSHEGDIRIESAPEQGTTVTITLPLRHAEPLAAASDSQDSKEVIIQ